MVASIPLAIVVGTAVAVGLLFYSFWDRISHRLVGLTSFFAVDLERAACKISSEHIVIGIIGVSLSAWLLLTILTRPSVAVSILILAGSLTMATYGFHLWVLGRVKKRTKAFSEQLEMVLRMMSNGLRVGLGIRQAIVLITEELTDPARGEFLRVFGQTNVGVPLNEALEALAQRMPSEELGMMVDAIRVQSQTGGDLAKIMDHLATTIKGRRAVARKIKSLTGEAVAGAWVLGALPLLVGGFVMGTQPSMRETMINTGVGHIGLIVFATLESLGIFTLCRMLAFEV